MATDLIGALKKEDFAYISTVLPFQPYRGVTSHFFHADLSHLSANIFGLVVARYFLKELKLQGYYFLLLLISLLIPLQALMQWILDIYILKGGYYLLLGFSGIIYGIDAFILLSSMYGKNTFLSLDIGLVKSISVRNAMLFLTGVGFAWSLLPSISFSAHFTGFISGALLFFL